MTNKAVRKRFVVKKRRKRLETHSSTEPSGDIENASGETGGTSEPSTSEPSAFESCTPRSFENVNISTSAVLCHDYAKQQKSPSSFTSAAECPKEKQLESVAEALSTELLTEVRDKIQIFLEDHWVPILRQNSISVVLVPQYSKGDNLCIQRNVVFYLDGNVEVFVHCQQLDVNQFMVGCDAFIPVDSDSINSFVDRAVAILNKVKFQQVCSGYDEEKYRKVWSSSPAGSVDSNPYQEIRYEETFRSILCKRLVPPNKWRCSECSKLLAPLKKRLASAEADTPCIFTANKFLTEEQKNTKLTSLRRELNNTKKKISRLRVKMQDLIEKNGVTIEESMSNDLTQLLEEKKVSPAQAIFLQQQIKASNTKNSSGMRWHPTMIRLALSVHIASPAAYEILRNSGMLKLPSGRTLFDYTHVKPVKEGIDQVVLDFLGEKVSKFPKMHMRYHTLMADEMHISQNLIFQKRTGKMVGYTSLDGIDKEVQAFEQYLDNPEHELQARIATKVLVFMVKGVSNGLKEVVAIFPVANPSVNQFYKWTWQVIRALESSKIYVIAFVTDGFSTNRAFIRRHKRASGTESSNVIFVTINKAAPHRNLYFIADVPHLLKTIRNCLLNSRSDKKKSRRKMRKNGKKISWDFIIRLFNAKKKKSLRKSFKLNAMNVFPDSYARMKVKYAAEVLSRTVAQDLEDQKWEEASELIYFIRQVNDWFDCLNGAHSNMGKRRRNKNLEPYTSSSDPRFKLLTDFLEYLHEWNSEAASTANVSLNSTVTADTPADAAPLDESDIEDVCLESEPETPAGKMTLSKQTLEGIEMTTLAFAPMVKFLLSEGADFINARVFCQDPLEQFFSKLRAGQGGSTNPNCNQVLYRHRAVHISRHTGMKRRGNAQEYEESAVDVSPTKLAKRKCVRRPKMGEEEW